MQQATNGVAEQGIYSAKAKPQHGVLGGTGTRTHFPNPAFASSLRDPANPSLHINLQI